VLVAIHKDGYSADSCWQVRPESLAERGIDTCWIDLAAPVVLSDIRQCNGLTWRWGKSHPDERAGRVLTKIGLELEILVFPNHRSSWDRRYKLMMAYDILMHGDVPVVLEMNFRNGKRSGYWTQNLNWVDKPILPQEAQVEVFLDIIRFEKNRRKETPFREYS
jgi:hypothetical protein